jgi:hypothetical protein
MDHAVPVGVAERGRHRPADPEGGIDRQRTFAVQSVSQALATGVGHDEVEQTFALT